jgi:flagellar motor switch protein FliN
MSESIEKKLISAIATSWNKTAQSLLKSDTELGLLAFREVSGDSMTGALAVAVTWSSAFAIACEGIPGILIFLFKNEDDAELERIIGQKADGSPKPGCRALLTSVLNDVANDISDTTSISFGNISYIDLSSDDTRLSKIVGDAAFIGTFSLMVGDQITSQALTLYAPNGSLNASQPSQSSSQQSTAPKPETNAPAAQSSASPNVSTSPSVSRRAQNKRDDIQPKNIERLLDVELDIIVRFGVTHIQLRDLVRIGVGTMIELKRTVDDPVELLVNGRPLARGEVVVVDGYYGVRITEIGSPAERASSILQ